MTQNIRFENYDVLQEAGQGGFGSVQIIREKATGNILAWKRLNLDNQSERTYAFEEALTLMRLDFLQTGREFAKTVVGTPEKADMFSFGVCLFELVMLRTPFEGDNIYSVAVQIVEQNPPPITAPISAEAKDLIMSLLSKDPKRRPASEDILALQQVRQRRKKFENPSNYENPTQIKQQSSSQTRVINDQVKSRGVVQPVQNILEQVVSSSGPPPPKFDLIPVQGFQGPPPGTKKGEITVTCVKCRRVLCIPQKRDGSVEPGFQKNKVLRCTCGNRFMSTVCSKCGDNLIQNAEGLPGIFRHSKCNRADYFGVCECGEIIVYDEKAVPGYLICHQCGCKFTAINCPECAKITHYKGHSSKYFYRCPSCQYLFYSAPCRCGEIVAFDAKNVPGGLRHSKCGFSMSVAECPTCHQCGQYGGLTGQLKCQCGNSFSVKL
ncbi:MAG: hypothetical protein EZS28_001651 [Streblomastix strix]|uniref:non-specific serine/threonine protein kinase n=1 Tax=Streblomastix strix TaxID=222440 RepID=A0A5J4X745_9EUKA|nr:MAG: hypothetical protein EZS28_001651 [Streblomastix strix]